MTLRSDCLPRVKFPQGLQRKQRGSRWLDRLKQGLDKTRKVLGTDVADLLQAGRALDENLCEELEAALLMADVGVTASAALMQAVRACPAGRLCRRRAVARSVEECAARNVETASPCRWRVDAHRPFVIMLAGVNGGKQTTSIGKIAHYYQSRGKSESCSPQAIPSAPRRGQLIAWGERNNVAVISRQSGDAAAVIYDAINAAQARGIDVALADTAGRLPTQLHLMEEIRKVKRVIGKALPGAPHEVLLVLDANNGQNALTQVKAFDEALGVTGLVLTKLDGTAKGGVIAAIAHMRSATLQGRPIPLRFIGVGEQLDDLRPFNAEEFVSALLE